MDGIRFGRSVKALRQRRGWRQVDLAVRAGLSRSVIGRIELGQVERVAYGDLEKVARALDGQLGLDFRWRGEALDRLIDERHAAIVDALVSVYRAAGWEIVVEASFSIFGERGSVDVFAYHPPTGLVAVNEVKASIADAGATVIGVDRKARLAPQIAKERGWPCRGVARFLVVAAGSTARGRIARHAAIFRTVFPAGTRESLAWIREPSALPNESLPNESPPSESPPSGIVFLAPRNSRPAGTQGARGR